MADGDLAWAKYNPDVIAQDCEHCGVKGPSRCKSPLGTYAGQIVPAHAKRIKAAGYRWSSVLGRLVQLTD